MNNTIITLFDIQNTKVYNDLPKERQFVIKKKSCVDKIQNNFNRAKTVGYEVWEKDTIVNNSIKRIIIELLQKKG